MRGLRWACAAVVMTAAIPASAQSLGEVAQKEQARRAEGTKSVKSFSNADLKPGEIVAPASPDSPTSPAACYMSVSENRCVSPEELVANSSNRTETAELKRNEPLWRRDAANLRTQIEKTLAELDLLAKLVANDSRSPGERDVAEERVARLEGRLENYAARWQMLEKRAADMRVPIEWLAPVPQLRRQ